MIYSNKSLSQIDWLGIQIKNVSKLYIMLGGKADSHRHKEAQKAQRHLFALLEMGSTLLSFWHI